MQPANFHFESLVQTMRDSVIVLSPERQVLFYNLAAKKLLQLESFDNLNYQQIPLQIRDIAEQIFFGDIQADGEIMLELDQSNIFIQVHAQVIGSDLDKKYLQTTNQKNVLIVLHDVSRLNQLENIRKEFVANVSHELKTPITSIKAAAETLQDGAFNDKEMMPKFLDIIARQSDRLNTIIEDLLSLSRLENEGTAIHLTEGSVLDVVSQAIAGCEHKANLKNININFRASSNLRTIMNATLLEQAIVNLIDNAIKYCEPNKIISVSAALVEDEIEISVEDNGYGIEAEHLPRIFERFYRVDKARSRHAGGSGLGLSIVKHIAQIHGGKAVVESTLGQGSKFSLFLPTAI